MKSALLVFTFALIGVDGQSKLDKEASDIAYVVTEANFNKENNELSSMCPKNQILYPSGQGNQWKCDCAPGLVYHLETGQCHRAYRRGPCNLGQYLVLAPNQFTPKCQNNPCRVDGMVLFKKQCWNLEKAGGPCSKTEKDGDRILNINPKTLQPECMATKREKKFIGKYFKNWRGTDKQKITVCPPQHRFAVGKCRKIYFRRKW